MTTLTGGDGLSYSIQKYACDGTTVTREFNFVGGYLDKSHIKAYIVNDDTQAITAVSLTFTGTNTVKVSAAGAVGNTLVVYRDTPRGVPLVDFSDGSVLSGEVLNTNAKQAVFIAAESVDRTSDTASQTAISFGGLVDSKLAAATTDILSEGESNLYFTPARAASSFDTRLNTKSSDSLKEGATNRYYTTDRAAAKADLAGAAFTGQVTVRKTLEVRHPTTGQGLSWVTDDAGNVICYTMTTQGYKALVYYPLSYTNPAPTFLIAPTVNGTKMLLDGDVTDTSVSFTFGQGAVAGTLRKKLSQTRDPSDLPFSADSTGVSDAKAALVSADADGPVIITGNHRVSSSMTFTNQVRFEQNGRLTIDSGANVHFSKGLTAHSRQIFYGSGSATTTGDVDVCWFAGDFLNTSTEVDTLLQRAANACPVGGRYRLPAGEFRISGATPIIFQSGQHITGCGWNTSIAMTGPVANGFLCKTSIGSLDGVSFRSATSNWPTSGVALDIQVSFYRFSNVHVDLGFFGVRVLGANGVKAHALDLFNCVASGLTLDAAGDFYASRFLITAGDRLRYSGGSGQPVAGEVLVFSGGAKADVSQVTGTGVLGVSVRDINPVSGETFTGQSSGCTGTVTAIDVAHTVGGIRIVNRCEAFIVSEGDVIGGSYPLYTDGGTSVGSRPAYGKFNSVFFDSGDQPAVVQNCAVIDFNSCWFSNRPMSGVILANCDGITFNGGGAFNCWQHGVIVQSTATNVTFNGFAARGNSQKGGAQFDGIVVAAGTTDFRAIMCTFGNGASKLGFGGQRYGLNILAGASDRYTIAFNNFNGDGGSLFDGGTGNSKTVSPNF